mgnify:CR=1 FL=1
MNLRCSSSRSGGGVREKPWSKNWAWPWASTCRLATGARCTVSTVPSATAAHRPAFIRRRKAAATLAKAGDLRTYETELRGNPKVRLIVNQNDFLLEERDLEWLRSTFGDELTSFKQGGHLGNLTNDAVHEAILNALKPIKEH